MYNMEAYEMASRGESHESTMYLALLTSSPIDLSWSEIPTTLIQAELLRRQDGERPQCGSGKKGSYNTPAHVFALVLILVLSTFGML